MKIRQAIRLFTQGKKKFFISRHLGLSRNTVDKYIAGFLNTDLTWEQVEKMSDKQLMSYFEAPEQPPSPRQGGLEEEFKRMEKLLGKPGQTRQACWLDYLQRKPGGYSYTQFCEYFRRWQKQTKPTLSIEHKAGDKLFIDFAGKRLSITDKETGEIKTVEVFLAVLGFSQMTYVEATLSQKKEDLIGAVGRAFLYYGGVPQAVVPDNLKSAVKKPQRYEPEINETFQDFALHYQTSVLPARVRKPQDKALVEIAVKLVYQRIYRDLQKQLFYSLEELNAAILILLDLYNKKRFFNRDYNREEVFLEVEQACLAPLPVEKYELRKYLQATVHKNYHVLLAEDLHYYSVPYQKIGEKVKVKYTSEEVWIYHNYELVAYHKRDRTRYLKTTDDTQRPKSHQAFLSRGPEEYLSQAEAVGEHALKLIEKVLERNKYLEHNYQSCQGILLLERKVGRERLELACKRALEYEVYNYKMVQSILEKGLEQAKEETRVIRLPGHENIRGNQYYK
jgi:transposase